MGSKLWLCKQLENTDLYSKETAIYGGWYGVTALLLLNRGKFNVEQIRSYDIDPACEPVADMINEYWVWQDWRFKAFTEDCNKIYTNADLIINTSTEHFENLDWWDNISPGTAVALQGNNMHHADHINTTTTLTEFCDQFPLAQELYRGSMDFVYPDWSFTRYMIIGTK
jgi:hypothetical protein